jgi:hypothetical protein
MAWVYLVNQTNRLLVLNLAPYSDGSLYIYPRQRVAVLEEECVAYEIQAALNSSPPRLVKMPAPNQTSATTTTNNAAAPSQPAPVVSPDQTTSEPDANEV